MPTSSLRSLIKPIPKGAGKDPYIPMNYRGISCVGKLYSAVLNDRLVEYLELFNLIADEQNGFRKDGSCEDHVFVLDYVVKNRLNNGQSTYVAFVDMAKAFDWVNEDFLLYKLLLSGVDENFYKSVKAMYTNTESCVKLNRMCIDFFDTTSGVRQGDVLSLTLFFIFINDLVEYLRGLNLGINIGESEIFALLYADDIALIADSPEKLQQLIQHVKLWCDKWRLSINTEKTQIVHLRKKKHLKLILYLYLVMSHSKSSLLISI